MVERLGELRKGRRERIEKEQSSSMFDKVLQSGRSAKYFKGL